MGEVQKFRTGLWSRNICQQTYHDAAASWQKSSITFVLRHLFYTSIVSDRHHIFNFCFMAGQSDQHQQKWLLHGLKAEFRSMVISTIQLNWHQVWFCLQPAPGQAWASGHTNTNFIPSLRDTGETSCVDMEGSFSYEPLHKLLLLRCLEWHRWAPVLLLWQHCKRLCFWSWSRSTPAKVCLFLGNHHLFFSYHYFHLIHIQLHFLI